VSSWYLYIIECERGRLYAGISPDVEKRFRLHAAGKGGAFTRLNPPHRIIAAAEFPDRSAATRAEIALKKLPREQKLLWARANPWRPADVTAAPTGRRDLDIGAFLERIECREPLSPSADALRGLHRAFMLSVPFENLDIHLGRPLSLEIEALADKIVRRHRGGFCYELNGLFAGALRELGFDVTLLSARVVHDGALTPEFDHAALLVRLEQRWLADVGFGDSFTEPLALDDPGDQLRDDSAYRVTRTGSVFSVLRRSAVPEWTPRYQFTLEPRHLSDFEAMCLYHQTSPESPFTRRRLCSRATHRGRVTISDDRLIQTVDGRRTDTRLTSLEEYVRALADFFGIDLAAAAAGTSRIAGWFSPREGDSR